MYQFNSLDWLSLEVGGPTQGLTTLEAPLQLHTFCLTADSGDSLEFCISCERLRAGWTAAHIGQQCIALVSFLVSFPVVPVFHNPAQSIQCEV
ncbi:hypothetical protein SUGI_0118840 [Cryptomeria japonica]|nr:hypothetical protein SUGI_0118840 [Cryptomeria japonica]